MILLDTNVVSEVMKPRPADTVLDWLDRRDAADLHLSTITTAEIEFGLQALPQGKRRRSLRDQFHRFLDRGFEGRLLPFDSEAALHYGQLMGLRRHIGRPMSILDGQIAAIARSRRFAIATRNVRDFEECGVEIFEPFKSPGT